ncbi:hypothetical protein JOD21_000646 [Jeotgalibacillus terrae]|nr:hypothetical protein [Jeotgalibacillus terrae]
MDERVGSAGRDTYLGLLLMSSGWKRLSSYVGLAFINTF